MVICVSLCFPECLSHTKHFPTSLVSDISYSGILSLTKLFLISNRGFSKISILQDAFICLTAPLKHACVALQHAYVISVALRHACFILIYTPDALAISENMSNPMCRESTPILYTCAVAFPTAGV